MRSSRYLLLLAILSLLLFAVTVLTVFGAPAPVYRKPAPLHVTAGDWQCQWGSMSQVIQLKDNWSYQSRWSCHMMYGSWGWCPQTRVLHIHETASMGNSWILWRIKLDDNLEGIAEPSGSKVRLWQKKPVK